MSNLAEQQAQARKLADAEFEARGIPAEGVLMVCVAAAPDGSLSVVEVEPVKAPGEGDLDAD